jgi:pSer/pThr/pTyr-binding forkhead associated (FHA) protein
MNPSGQPFCDSCGNRLGSSELQQPAPGRGARLMVASSGIAFDLTGKNTAIIGRADPVSGVNPDVDLTPHGGDEGGVSRRHAELSFNGYQWQIKDLNSTNGSYVNNQRLNANVPQLLNSNDQIRLGRVGLVSQTG